MSVLSRFISSPIVSPDAPIPFKLAPMANTTVLNGVPFLYLPMNTYLQLPSSLSVEYEEADRWNPKGKNQEGEDQDPPGLAEWSKS